jgi:hypothetical protein
MALVIAEDAVARIRKPDGAVRRHHHIVRSVELLALEAVDQDGDRAIGLGAGDAPRIVLAGDQPAFAVTGIAVRVIGVGAENAQMAVVLKPTHDAIVGYVAP